MARPGFYGGTHVSVSGGPRPQPVGIPAWRWGMSLEKPLAGKLRRDGVQERRRAAPSRCFKGPQGKGRSL